MIILRRSSSSCDSISSLALSSPLDDAAASSSSSSASPFFSSSSATCRSFAVFVAGKGIRRLQAFRQYQVCPNQELTTLNGLVVSIVTGVRSLETVAGCIKLTKSINSRTEHTDFGINGHFFVSLPLFLSSYDYYPCGR